jgi:RNA polymerase sigma factor (TIGR02999 family)
MNPAEPGITRLLQDWRDGDKDALKRLIPLVYDELHVIASRYMAREWRAGALQTTALVNEAYVRLVDQRGVAWQNRAHFFAIAATVMRRIVIDHARREHGLKRGGDMVVPADGERQRLAQVTAQWLDEIASVQQKWRRERPGKPLAPEAHVVAEERARIADWLR